LAIAAVCSGWSFYYISTGRACITHVSRAKDEFGTQHLADVLNAAFASFEDIEKGVAMANTKREVLKSVLSCKTC